MITKVGESFKTETQEKSASVRQAAKKIFTEPIKKRRQLVRNARNFERAEPTGTSGGGSEPGSAGEALFEAMKGVKAQKGAGAKLRQQAPSRTRAYGPLAAAGAAPAAGAYATHKANKTKNKTTEE